MKDSIKIQLTLVKRSKQGIGEVDLTVAPDHDVVGRIESLALEFVHQYLNLSFAIGSGDAPRFVLAGVQAPLAIHRVPVGTVGILPIDFRRPPGDVFVEPVLAIVAKDQKALARPDRSLAAREALGDWFYLQVREILSGQYRCRQQQ